MKEVTHAQLTDLIQVYYDKKDRKNRKYPLWCSGAFGIGKSNVVEDAGEKIAARRGKKFVNWNNLTHDERLDLVNDPSGKFVLIDIRMAEYDSSDIKGIPDFMEDRESVSWKPPFWTKLVRHPDADGILFFDEFNLAAQSVQSSAYKIFLDRVVCEDRMADDFLVIAAGNRLEDMCNVSEVPAALQDRCGQVELKPPTIDQWSDWAIRHEIDSRIIGYLNWKSSSLHVVNEDATNKFTTERGWERVSNLIKGVQDPVSLQLISSSAIGENIAVEFSTFCKLSEKVNLSGIIRDPEQIRTIDALDTKYFVIMAIADQYKDSKVKFNFIARIGEILDETGASDFVVLLWKCCNMYKKNKFKKDFLAYCETNQELVEKYAKYLL